MANIDAFYPQRLKGWALGLNAGGGNIGVAAVQLVGLAVLATAGAAHPRLILAVYIPLIVVATAGAALYMDNLTHVRNEKGAMREVARDRHAWIISFLYIGTFGSFIGFGFAFGQVLQVQFGDDVRHADAGRRPDVPRPAARLAVPARRRPARRPLRRVAGHARSRSPPWRSAPRVVLVASLIDSLPLFVAGFVASSSSAGSATARRTR